MKIKNIYIQNYRSLAEVEIMPKNILCLVGRNNSGKSNILKALQLFFEANAKLVSDECFYNRCLDKEIIIRLHFDELCDWEKEQFKTYLTNNDLIIERIITMGEDNKIKISTNAIVEVPKYEWLQPNLINGNNINKWWKEKDILKFNGINFGVRLGNRKPTVGKWKEEAEKFVRENYSSIPFIKKRIENPKGYSNVLKGALPEFIYIPAVRDIKDEAKITQSNPLGAMIGSLLKKIPPKKLEKISEDLLKISKRLNRDVNSDERYIEIKNLEDKLNKFMSELMDCYVELEITLPKVEDLFKNIKILIDDGIKTSVETKGHGLQRSMIFTILRVYAEYLVETKVSEKTAKKCVIFAIEEPELYLHPQSQRTFMSVLRCIAESGNQVLYSTQSSLFVNIEYFDEICIIRREKEGGSYRSKPTQLSIQDLLKTFDNDCKTKKTDVAIREIYSNTFNSLINEGFFADKVVIVEGLSEQYSLPIYAKILGYDLDRDNISIVSAGGKGPIAKILLIFEGFGIPTYIIFDGDKKKKDERNREITLKLLNILGNPCKDLDSISTTVTNKYALFEDELESTLRKEIKDYDRWIQEATTCMGKIGKPLKQRFIANKFKKLIEEGDSVRILPPTIVEIIERIKIL